MNETENLLNKLAKNQKWHSEPVYCFTSDIDWASEDVMKVYFEKIGKHDIKPTLFVTHESDIIQNEFEKGTIERGIHPNFLEKSSHGNSFEEVIETVKTFAPESYGFRSHRLFDVTDITHSLKNNHGYKYVSNLGTILQQHIVPILHESGLIHIPIFFEDGTHLYNKLNLDFTKYIDYFNSPGIKIISFHPMNYVFNSPNMHFMRSIKDSLSRQDYNNISTETINRLQHKGNGIGKTVDDIIAYATSKNYMITSLNEVYNQIVL